MTIDKPTSVTVEVPANIALVKYWGKRNETLVLPLNDSISLSIDAIRARTTVKLAEKDSVTINNKPVDLDNSPRFSSCFNNCVQEVRRILRKRSADGKDWPPASVHFEVSSTTNFPVAAGLASSAAGFGAIAVALGHLFDIPNDVVSMIARKGSGSACRSVCDGLVHWKAGTNSEGTDCYSESMFPSSYWPELRAVIVVLNSDTKETGSTDGMRNSMETSKLLQHRTTLVPPTVKRVQEAFEKRNFSALAEEIIRDSNQFHAVCMDTYPPLRYMNDSSWKVIRAIEDINHEDTKAAYTFDAGPNPCIFTLVDHVDTVVKMLETVSDGRVIVSTVGSGPRIVEQFCQDSRSR